MMSTAVQPQRGLSAIEPYVPGKPIEEVQREYGLDDVIKLASNENPLGPSPGAVRAVSDALSQLNVYPDAQSYTLRHAIAERFEIAADHVVVGNGADGVILQTCMAYLDDQSDVIVSRSSFPVYDRFTHAMRARLIKTPLKDYRLDLDAMADAITARTKLVFVCNPNNPTGTIVTTEEVEAFMARVPDHALVIFDEAYCELVDSDAYPDTMAYLRKGRPNVMVMRTFSKVYGIAGVRLGYAFATPEVLAALNQVKEPFAVNLLAQVAGIAALADEAFLERSIAANSAGRLALYEQFDRLGLPYIESHANFVLVEFGTQALAIQERLLRKGVIVRGCVNYDLCDFLRITVGSEAQNARLIRALEEVLQELGPDIL
jgi:histidinol-phosphate aminotransferase